MKSFVEMVADFIDAMNELDRAMAEMYARPVYGPPTPTMPVAPQHPRQQRRTPATAQRYLRQSTRRTQGRKGRLPARVKV